MTPFLGQTNSAFFAQFLERTEIEFETNPMSHVVNNIDSEGSDTPIHSTAPTLSEASLMVNYWNLDDQSYKQVLQKNFSPTAPLSLFWNDYEEIATATIDAPGSNRPHRIVKFDLSTSAIAAANCVLIYAKHINPS